MRFNRRVRLFSGLCAALLLPEVLAASPAPPSPQPPAEVRFVTDQAEAVLAILAQRAQGQPVTEEDWRRLFATEGYTRLAKREASMGRAFTEEDFKAFVLSGDLLARAEALRETLAAWTRSTPDAAARRALAYLPAEARIRARIYPVIKPRDNSFVFEVKTAPAIFVCLDPKVTLAQLENTMAHELHHIGYGTVCPLPAATAEIERLPPGARSAAGWMRAFSEGFAMLAAAGGPDVHPHAVSATADRERWDRDVARFEENLREVERFFLDLLAGRLEEKAENEKASSFYGIQGPWYTVGWKMAATVEEIWGRERLIADSCDPRKLLASYNEAVRRKAKEGEAPVLWSDALLEAVGERKLPQQ